MKNTDGGPAYPTVYVEHGEVIELHTGMTKLDYFAAEAMQGLLPSKAVADSCGELIVETDIVYLSFKLAEAMLAESEKRNEARESDDGKA